MKGKILIALFILVVLLFGSGITYSIFHSSTSMIPVNQGIAKFIFNANEETDNISIPLADIKPGEFKDYQFSVSNKEGSNTSNVTLQYKIIVKTYHIMPLQIKLISVDDTDKNNIIEEEIMNCDTSYPRNANNELVCNSRTLEMSYRDSKQDQYVLRATFPDTFSDEIYSNLVDYVDLEINSWQKIR